MGSNQNNQKSQLAEIHKPGWRDWSDYSVIPNAIWCLALDCERKPCRLSPAARLVMAWAVGRPGGWQFRIGAMLGMVGLTENQWRTARKELMVAGYFFQKKAHVDGVYVWAQGFVFPAWLDTGDAAETTNNRREDLAGEPPPRRKVAPEKKQSAVDLLVGAGVDSSVARDFASIRRARRAPITQTAIDELLAQAGEVGITLNDALRQCCARGWPFFDGVAAESRDLDAAFGRR